jgi:hypothetical protein
MRLRWVSFLPATALAVTISARGQSPGAAAYWPQWRGPLSTGEAPLGDPPVRWDERTHIRCKAAIPGLGHATPVVWGDRIFVQTAVAAGDGAFRYDILSLSREDGRLLWRRTTRTEAPHEGRHEDGSWASGSPVTDGEHVFAFFGSWSGLHCGAQPDDADPQARHEIRRFSRQRAERKFRCVARDRGKRAISSRPQVDLLHFHRV